MAVKEKKVVQEILVCDNCESDIDVASTATKIEGSASGYMKKEHLALDLCENCATRMGLKRRGRPVGSLAAAEVQAPKKRGRPRKTAPPAESADPAWEYAAQ